MQTTKDRLQEILNAKQGIKVALVEKGVNMAGVVFSQYPGKISELPGGETPPQEDVPAVFRGRLQEAMAANPQFPYGIICAIEVDDAKRIQTFSYLSGVCNSMHDVETGVNTNVRCEYKFLFSDGGEYAGNFTHVYDSSKYFRVNDTDYMYMILIGAGNYIKQGGVNINDVSSNSYIYQYVKYVIFSEDACIFSANELSKCNSLEYIEFGRNSVGFGVNTSIAYGGFRFSTPRFVYNLNCGKLSSSAEMAFPANVEDVSVRNIERSINLMGRGRLSSASVVSIFNALCDNSENAGALSITLPALVFVHLTDEMKLIATTKNWTIAKGNDY